MKGKFLGSFEMSGAAYATTGICSVTGETSDTARRRSIGFARVSF